MNHALRAPLTRTSRWGLLGGGEAIVQTTDSALATGASLSLRGGLSPGYYGARRYLAFDAGVQWTPATYLATHEGGLWEAPRGWYANTATYLETGLIGGFSISERAQVRMHAHVDLTFSGAQRTAPIDLGLALVTRL